MPWQAEQARGQDLWHVPASLWGATLVCITLGSTPSCQPGGCAKPCHAMPCCAVPESLPISSRPCLESLPWSSDSISRGHHSTSSAAVCPHSGEPRDTSPSPLLPTPLQAPQSLPWPRAPCPGRCVSRAVARASSWPGRMQPLRVPPSSLSPGLSPPGRCSCWRQKPPCPLGSPDGTGAGAMLGQHLGKVGPPSPRRFQPGGFCLFPFCPRPFLPWVSQIFLPVSSCGALAMQIGLRDPPKTRLSPAARAGAAPPGCSVQGHFPAADSFSPKPQNRPQ